MKTTTILIVDDHTLLRETWSYILNHHSGFTVIAGTGSVEEAFEMAKLMHPEVILLDINLPGMNGIEAVPHFRKFSPESKIIGVSLHTQPMYARKMIQNGAHGYVTKNSGREELFDAIAEVTNGRKYICQEIKNVLSEQLLSGDAPRWEGASELSMRELEIIKRIKMGASSKEIAEALRIAVKTVEVHRYNILRKLKLKNAAALVNYMHNSELGMTI